MKTFKLHLKKKKKVLDLKKISASFNPCQLSTMYFGGGAYFYNSVAFALVSPTGIEGYIP